MGTAYGIPDCLGWYLAGAGVFADAGVTPAQAGDTVAQWNDQSGAGNNLSQAVAADRPVLQAVGTVPSVGFDSASSTALNLPALLSIPGGAATVLLCTRGSGAAVIGLASLAYGGVGVADAVGVLAGDGTFRNGRTFLPVQHPIVHGFTAAAGTVTLLWGTGQSTALPGAAVSGGGGGVLGRSTGSTAGFTGDVLELAVFDRVLDSAEIATVLAGMQVNSALPSDADANLLLLIGDEQVAGEITGPYTAAFPFWLDQVLHGSCCPLMLAAAGQTCATQQTTLQATQAALNLDLLSTRIAVICCGVNDVLVDNCTAAEVIDRFTALVETIRQLGMVRLIAAVPLLAATGASGTQQAAIDSFRTWLRAGAGGAVDAVVDWTADARLVDAAPQPVFRSGAVQTTPAGSRVKASLILPATGLSSAAGTVSPAAALSFGNFYAAGRPYAGMFGQFVQG